MKNVLVFKNLLVLSVAFLTMSADGCFNFGNRGCDFEKMSQEISQYFNDWYEKATYNPYSLTYSDCTNFKRGYDELVRELVACPEVDATSKSILNDANREVQSWNCADWVSIQPENARLLMQKMPDHL